MSVAILSILGGLVLLIAGGEGTVRGATATALRLKVPTFVIGATVVAFGTSAPELVVTLTASLRGSPGIALGNVLGSNIANLGLILGLSAIVRPVAMSRKTFLYETPLILLVMMMMVLTGWNSLAGRIEGFLLLFCIIYAIIHTLRGMKKNDAVEESVEQPKFGIILSILMLLVGIILLILGSNFLVDGAVIISRYFGISEYIIGAVIVAVGTSLPEVAASVAAAYHKRGDLAIGNVFGSNAFNVLFVLGTGASIHPIQVAENIKPDLMYYSGLTLIPLGWLLFRGILPRWMGMILLVAYILYIISNFVSI